MASMKDFDACEISVDLRKYQKFMKSIKHIRPGDIDLCGVKIRPNKYIPEGMMILVNSKKEIKIITWEKEK